MRRQKHATYTYSTATRALGVSVLVFACADRPWALAGVPDVPPDEQFRLGVETFDNVYVWNCFHGKRVRIAQPGGACVGSTKAVMEESACGEMTRRERLDAVDSGSEQSVSKERLPSSAQWPGSTGGATPKR